MIIISTSLTVPTQPSPRFHVEAWLPFRNREMYYCVNLPRFIEKVQKILIYQLVSEINAQVLHHNHKTDLSPVIKILKLSTKNLSRLSRQQKVLQISICLFIFKYYLNCQISHEIVRSVSSILTQLQPRPSHFLDKFCFSQKNCGNINCFYRLSAECGKGWLNEVVVAGFKSNKSLYKLHFYSLLLQNLTKKITFLKTSCFLKIFKGSKIPPPHPSNMDFCNYM